MGFRLTEGYIDLTTREGNFNSVMGKVRRILSGASLKMDTLSRTAKRMFLATSAAAGVSLKAYGSFEGAMRKATAVSEVTDRQFEKMSKMAEEQSVRLNMAATKTANAFYYLGSAGLNVRDQIEAYVPVATLAKAATIEMGQAAEMVVDTMKGFQIDFKNTTHVTDVMAKAVTSSNMTFSQMGEALALVSGVAETTNNSLEETAAMLATMADVGIKGTMAGTSLRRALLNLAAPLSNTRKLFAHYGIEIYDANGKMKPFIQLVGEISEILKDATEQERNMAFQTMFGARAIAGQIAVFNRGQASLKQYIKELENSGGTAEKVAKKQMGFSEQVGQTWQKIKKLTVHIGDLLAPAFLKLSNALGANVDKLTAFVDKHSLAISKWAERTAAKVNFVQNLFVKFVKFLQTDFRTGAKWGLDAVLEEFKAFGKSLMMVMEKIFTDLYNNVGVWIERAFAKRLEYERQYQKKWQELTYWGSPWRGEAKKAEAHRYAQEQMALAEKQGIFEIAFPLKETTTWEAVEAKITEIQKKVLEKIAKTAPPELTAAYEKERIKLARKLAEIEAKYFFEEMSKKVTDLGESVKNILLKPFKGGWFDIFGGKAGAGAAGGAAPTGMRVKEFGFADVTGGWKSLIEGIRESNKADLAKQTAESTQKTAEAAQQTANNTQKSLDVLGSLGETIGNVIVKGNIGAVAP